ncbi:unnamed protein product [Xylocopa violacea]|uniref:Cadherin domain-containing protein n=1 Tax=Xylocopa violacea TaxID=135666 RepID=A0ABP1PJL1_XYLVO
MLIHKHTRRGNGCFPRDSYRLRVRASDRGTQVLHADVDVELDVVDRNNKPPVWDANVYGPIHIKENVTVGTVVTAVKARFVCHDMTETRHVTCRAVPCIATPLLQKDCRRVEGTGPDDFSGKHP